MLRLISIVLLLTVSANAQVPNWPAWANGELSMENIDAHPTFATVPEELRLVTRNGLMATIHGSYFLLFDPYESEIAVKFEGEPDAVIDTGIDNVFGVRSVRLGGEKFGANQGILVFGKDANGIPRIKYSPWINEQDLSAVVFGDIVPAFTNQETIVCADIVGTDLYIIEASSLEIRKFYDSDSDDLPDAASTVLPLDLSTVDPMPAIIQFFLNDDGDHCIEDLVRDEINLEDFTYLTSGGSLEIAVHRVEFPTFAVPVLSFGHKPLDGMSVLPTTYYGGVAMVWAEDGLGRKISSVGAVSEGYSETQLELFRPLFSGQTIYLKASDGSSSDALVVGDAKPILFRSAPFEANTSEPIVILAANLDPENHEVSMTLDLGPEIPAIDPNMLPGQLIVQAPVVTGTTAVLMILIIKLDGETVTEKELLVYPEL